MKTRFISLVDALRTHASTHPLDRAYVALDERGAEAASLSFAELDRRASQLAAALAVHAGPGARALLAFPPGLDFIVAFFACQYASIIAVPTILARYNQLRESSAKIVDDCRPELGLTTSARLASVQHSYASVPSAARISWLAVDAASELEPSARPQPIPRPDTLALLQYTSGSTSAPKGVIVSHGNLAANAEMISLADELDRGSTRVGWIPLYHDMGLVFNALQATYVGALCVLMAPARFAARPLSWLRAIHEYRADMAIAPNFAYDLCVEQYDSDRMQGVDLSCWRLALNGAEPVRAATLDRFVQTFAAHGLRASAPHPTYGMAEATLMISGGLHGHRPRLWAASRAELERDRVVSAQHGKRTQILVGCGKALPGESVAIVDPETCQRLAPGRIGEIWVSGPNVAQGYWKAPEATAQTFHAEIEGEVGEAWLRTGDLGCLDESGELFITGRCKDMMIVRGANYYPQDIELTAEESHPAVRRGYSAAFTVPEADSSAWLAIACEVRKGQLARLDLSDVQGAIREAIVREHGLTAHRVILLRPGAIPKTTSGKIRRAATRERWQRGELADLSAASAAQGHASVARTAGGRTV